ncbi:MAG: double-strand break repair helicase AddA [Rhodobacteraceae bacterium]|nr:double-strand break repair helicase AddA [Paracoccaceae bacterium]
MSELRKKEATKAQNDAALPVRSAWVSANAGSGKTRVLTNRVARLLLQGTEPGRILCLTFTKAAAAEMQNRLFEQLGEWAMLPDAPLRDALAALGEKNLPQAQLVRARSLFARALETPGGLKIQTIHAFCESLLHRFPLEAQVAPDFTLLDDRQAEVLRQEVLDEMAEQSPELYDRFIELNEDPTAFLGDILKHQQLFSTGFDPEIAAAEIGAEPGLVQADILARVMEGFSDTQISSLATAMAVNTGGHDLKTSETLKKLKDAPDITALELLEAVFLTSGKRRSTRSFPNKKTKSAYGEAEAMVSELIERVYAARQSRLAQAAYEKAEVLHGFAVNFLYLYAQRKSARAALEFEDLIRKADGLLRQSDMAQWVLYRLDGGIDHILVDEAQDTSPLQWDIVMALAEEIYAAAEVDGPARTIFVVGDEKQSIFSFQGADPGEFSRIKALLHTRLQAVGSPMFEGALLCSFRSASPILQVVDKVFEGEARGGIEGEITHISADETLPGRVEVWPYYEKADKPELLPWDAPVDARPASDPVFRLAEDIAERVEDIINSKMALPGQERAIQAGDFLILVQSRSELFRALLKELKARGVPVAGADRLKVVEELAVRDLLAVLQFAANPRDDLGLACALRSPLCGVSESGLFTAAHGRTGSLWQAVPRDEMLADILAHADFERPYELLERILIRHNGRKKLLARLGPEAEEGIDELLRLALEYERGAAPLLTGFLEWVHADEIEVKRRFNAADNLLRVMTVHGAKGLESPIVILPQTVKKARNADRAVLPVNGNLAVCGRGVATLPEKLSAVQQRETALQTEERMRLLYVAMTRTESWLIVAGSGTRNAGSDNWYDKIYEACEALGGKKDSHDRLVFENRWDLQQLAEPAASASPASPAPGWMAKPVINPAKPPRTKAPSDLGGGHTVEGTPADEEALLRGEQVHILLDNLVETPAEDRLLAAQRLLEFPLDGVIETALATLESPTLAPVFAKEALREVPVSATLPGLGPIMGRIDVLLVGDVITAIDFKTNRKVPVRCEDIPEGFLRQMGAYRAALALIWPAREIKTAILWTAEQSLMEIPPALSDAALHRATNA